MFYFLYSLRSCDRAKSMYSFLQVLLIKIIYVTDKLWVFYVSYLIATLVPVLFAFRKELLVGLFHSKPVQHKLSMQSMHGRFTLFIIVLFCLQKTLASWTVKFLTLRFFLKPLMAKFKVTHFQKVRQS